MHSFYKNTKIILGKYYSKIFYIILLFPIVSFFDVASLYLIIKYLSTFASNDSYVNFYAFVLYLPNELEERNQFMLYAGLIILFIFTLKSIINFIIQIIIINFTFFSSTTIIKRLFDYYLFNLIEQSDKKNISKAIQNITNHTFVYVHQGLFSFLKILSEFFLFLAILALLVLENIGLTIVLLSFFTILVISYLIFTRLRIKQGAEIISNAQKKVINLAKESLQGIEEVFVYNLQKKILSQVKIFLTKYKDSIVRYQILQDLPKHILEYTLILLLLTYILYFFYFNQTDNDVLENIILFGLAALRLAPSLSQIIVHVNNIRFAKFASNALRDEIIITDKGNRVFTQNSEKQDDFDRFEIKDCYFKYPGSRDYVLQGLNFSISKGEMVGIMGESGSGKTSFIKLILGINKFNAGESKINKIEKDLITLKDNIAYVSQKSIVFDGTIKENIVLFDNNFDSQRFENSINLAKIDWLSRDDLEMKISSDDPNMSGGQLQRIAIARAFYSEREIMVLDEITSALDTESVSDIQESLLKMKNKKTIIIITHNSELLRDCDIKLEMEDGHLKKIEN